MNIDTDLNGELEEAHKVVENGEEEDDGGEQPTLAQAHRLNEDLWLVGEDIKEQSCVLFCEWMGVEGFGRLPYYAVENNLDPEGL